MLLKIFIKLINLGKQFENVRDPQPLVLAYIMMQAADFHPNFLFKEKCISPHTCMFA